MKITYYGHSCFRVEMNGKHLLFDPFISPNPHAAKINLDEIPADYILVSHGHADHVADAERIAKRTGAPIISNFEIVTWFGQRSIKGHGMNHGGKHRFEFGTVKYVYATHSSVLPDGTYGGNPGGFVVWDDDQCFYFAGDTALTFDMKTIPLTCPRLNFAILPIGDNFTMDATDAAIAAEFIECDTVVGCHFDTFDVIKIDHSAAKAAFDKRGKTLILPAIGQTLEL